MAFTNDPLYHEKSAIEHVISALRASGITVRAYDQGFGVVRALVYDRDPEVIAACTCDGGLGADQSPLRPVLPDTQDRLNTNARLDGSGRASSFNDS